MADLEPPKLLNSNHSRSCSVGQILSSVFHTRTESRRLSNAAGARGSPSKLPPRPSRLTVAHLCRRASRPSLPDDERKGESLQELQMLLLSSLGTRIKLEIGFVGVVVDFVVVFGRSHTLMRAVCCFPSALVKLANSFKAAAPRRRTIGQAPADQTQTMDDSSG